MLLLTFDKMAKFKTIKTIVMKRSDVVLKTAIITKILFQLWHGNHLKSNVGILQSLDKMAKFQTIKTICMILTWYLKAEIYTKMLSQFSHEFFKQKYGNHGVPVKCFGD